MSMLLLFLFDVWAELYVRGIATVEQKRLGQNKHVELQIDRQTLKRIRKHTDRQTTRQTVTVGLLLPLLSSAAATANGVTPPMVRLAARQLLRFMQATEVIEKVDHFKS